MHARHRAAEEQAPGKSFDRLFGVEPGPQSNYPSEPSAQAPAPPISQYQAAPSPARGPTGAAVPMSYADSLNRVNQSNGGAGPTRAPAPVMQAPEQTRSRQRINHNLTSKIF